jgi:hypothetical protein
MVNQGHVPGPRGFQERSPDKSCYLKANILGPL